MRTPVGFFMDENMKNKSFNKLPTSIEEQIHLLRSRGIIINDAIKAKHYLTFISYYRFCGYAIDFENHQPNGNKNTVKAQYLKTF